MDKSLGLYYDKYGVEIDLDTWRKLLEGKHYMRVAKTTVGETTISTIWLGINSTMRGGEPLIFETMAFTDFDDPKRIDNTGEQERYSTLQEAEAGHKRWVEKYEMEAKGDTDNFTEPK